MEEKADAISEAMFSAWSYFHVLEGIHSGSKSHPAVVQKFDRLFEQVWRATFDALFAKIGTLIDRDSADHTLFSFITLTKRYGDADLKASAKRIETKLNAPDGPIEKMRRWRHDAVAHHTPHGRTEAFYEQNKMHLTELAEGLRDLQALLNALCMNTLCRLNDTETGSEDLVREGIELFACVADHEGALPSPSSP